MPVMIPPGGGPGGGWLYNNILWRARPKSQMRACPASSIRMLDDFRSRCTTAGLVPCKIQRQGRQSMTALPATDNPDENRTSMMAPCATQKCGQMFCQHCYRVHVYSRLGMWGRAPIPTTALQSNSLLSNLHDAQLWYVMSTGKQKHG